MWLKVMLVSLFGCSSIPSADLGNVMLGNRMAAVPLENSLGEGELDTDGVCSKHGMACQNCTFAVTCISLPVGWLKMPLKHCPEGQTCNAHLQECSEETVPECDAAAAEYQHSCEQIGIFPDPYDCRKFHLCSPPEGLPHGRPALHRVAVCPRHYGYDADTAICSIELENGMCTSTPVPNCTKVGETGSLENSSYYYYVCLLKHGKLYPRIFVCHKGQYYYNCNPHPEVETSEASSTTEITISSTTE